MGKKYIYLMVIFLVVASFVAFGRIAGNDFINIDDDIYITENYHVQSGINLQNIKWAFTTIVAVNWHPLTLLSHTLDWSLFGANSSSHHLVSLLLHIGAVLFLFLFLNKTTNDLWPAAFAAAFFALHPLRVESVAWAAERKDVLSMFFGMASIYAYAFYAENSKLSKYLLCLILFALALMSKPMLVTLPFVLMLLDYWPLKRWQKALDKQGKRFNSVGGLIWEKIPFICLTIVSSIVTLWAQKKGGATSFGDQLPFVIRAGNAIVSYVAYLQKTFWPENLAMLYSYGFSLSLWKVLISAIILLEITFVVLYYIKKIPFLFTGWFWFLGTLIPVIGLVQVGAQAMADRYTYLPSIGIGIMLAWCIPFLFQREYIRKKVLLPLGLATITILIFLTWQQCGYWKNSVELFNHSLQVTKDNFMAHLCRGAGYVNLGQCQLAIEDYDEAIRLKPHFVEAYHKRGYAYAKFGQFQRAIEDYNKAIHLDPYYADVYNERGITYGEQDQYHLAIKDFNEAIRLNYDNAEAHNNRGFSYFRLGQNQRAIDDYNEAIRMRPNYAMAYKNRGIIYIMQGNKNLGCRDAQKACELGECKLLGIAKGKGYCR